MKMYKTNIYLILTILLMSFMSCVNSQEIDFENPFENNILLPDNKTKATFNNLKLFFEDALLNQENPAEIVSFKLMTITDKSTETNNIVIIGYNSNKTIKIACQLVNNGSNLLMSNTTVTCIGCSDGCNPEKSEGNWICSHCSNNDNCVKAVTVTVD